MITLLMPFCNDFSESSVLQSEYDDLISGLQLQTVECPCCGKTGCLIKHSSYERDVKCLSNLVELNVKRVLCKNCGKTHALLPSFIVPNSQILLQDMVEILQDLESHTSPEDILSRNILIDENNVKYIKRVFDSKWRQRLRSLGLSLWDDLTGPCLKNFALQFMQNSKTINRLYAVPT